MQCKKDMVCIACPLGCRLEVQYLKTGDGQIAVIGNKCKRGEAYAIEELTAPRRTVTAVVETNSEILPYVPVRTDKSLPKELIDKLLGEIYSTQVSVPLILGQVLFENYEDSGVNVVFSRSLPE